MAFYPIGHIIRSRREELGITQEDLSDGICSVSTLSRIENNERYPTKNHIDMLLQRLGYCSLAQDFITDPNTLRLSELKFQIRLAYGARDLPALETYLAEIEPLLDKASPIDLQFYILYSALLDSPSLPPRKKLEQLEKALVLTCPSYAQGKPPRILSYEEIVLLRSIALCLNALDDTSRAIELLCCVRDYYQLPQSSTEESLRTQPMVLHDLSKYLLQGGQLDECIETCGQGIRLALDSGRCQFLHRTLYNRGRALLARGAPGDPESARKDLEQAFRLAAILKKAEDTAEIAGFYRQVFREDPPA